MVAVFFADHSLWLSSATDNARLEPVLYSVVCYVVDCGGFAEGYPSERDVIQIVFDVFVPNQINAMAP